MNPLPASLLASLWQAGAIWGVLHLLLRGISVARCGLRYKLAMAALLLVAGCWAATWWHEAGATSTAAMPAHSADPLQFNAPVRMIESRTISSAPPAPIPWQRVLVAAWQLGVVVGIIRICRAMRTAVRIRATSVPVEDPAWRRTLGELCDSMGQKLTVCLRTSTQVAGPVVMGVVRPVIILPASALTGVPPEILRAALAHEIAHIVRWDYLANLVQMGIEALLFFNPFVWLISQSARREREACCDLAASQACSGPLAYSEALLWWSRELPTGSSAALAIGAKERSLLGRVQRLLSPAMAPWRPGGWWGGASVAALVPLFLILSAVVIHAAVSELSPQQRIALMDLLAKPFLERKVVADMPRKPFSGVVRDELGNPIEGADWRVQVQSIVDPFMGSTAADGAFAGEAPRWPLELIVRAKDFAPTVLNFGANDLREGITVTLQRGHDLRILCLGKDGQPIPGAQVRIESEGIRYWQGNSVTDKTGWALLGNLPASGNAKLTISANGHESARFPDIDLAKSQIDQPFVLIKSAPVTIRVVDELTREPIPGVKIRIESASSGASFTYPEWNSSGKETSADGTVVLDGLNPDLNYTMTAQGQDRHTSFQLDPRQDNRRAISLPRERKLALKIINLPDLAGKKLSLQYSQQITPNSSAAHSIQLEPIQGEAAGTIGGLAPKGVYLRFLGEGIQVPNLSQETTELTIDYEKIKTPPLVRVTIKAKVPRGQSPPKGAYWLNWAPTEDAGVWDGKSVPIHDGVAEAELPAHSRFMLRNPELIGGRVDENIIYRVSGSATTVDVPVTPAGMIRVKVLEPDGRLADDIFISAGDRAKPDSQRVDIKNMATSRDAKEWFISEPVDLGMQECQVVATSGLRYAISRPFKLDAANPLQDVVLTLPPPRVKTLPVVDGQGRPLPGLSLSLEMEVSPIGRTFGRNVTTDANGIATIILGDIEPKKITARPLSVIYIPERYPLDLSGSQGAPLVMKEGRKLAGRIVNRSTTGNVANCSVYWADNERGVASELQGVDAEGRFSFQNAPNHEVFLSTSYPRGTEIKGNTTVTPGDEEIVLELIDAVPR